LVLRLVFVDVVDVVFGLPVAVAESPAEVGCEFVKGFEVAGSGIGVDGLGGAERCFGQDFVIGRGGLGSSWPCRSRL
jgi:hypothetical protein